jgi:hypothetical protein
MTAPMLTGTPPRRRAARPQVVEITGADISDAAAYLARTLGGRVDRGHWAAAMRAPWQRQPRNHGMMLRSGDTIVGVHLALYAHRTLGDDEVETCNLAVWCVDPDARHHGIRLLQALLAQEGLEFVDLSPSGNVVALNERLGFRHLDTTTVVLAETALRTRRRGTTITTDPLAIERGLDGAALRTYLDHRSSPAAHHVLVVTPDGACHVMYRRDRRRNLPLFASLLHFSEPAVLDGALGPLQRHIVRRQRVPFVLCETRLLGGLIPRGARPVGTNRPKMYRSARIDAGQVDNLYSELTEVAW